MTTVLGLDHAAQCTPSLGCPVLLRVEYEGLDLPADYVTDIGEDGLAVQTEQLLSVGQELRLVLSFPGLLAPTRLLGVVRCTRHDNTPEGRGRQTGVVLDFAWQTQGERQTIDRLLQVLRASPSARTMARPLKVLLVDDNRFVSELFKHAISRFQRLAQLSAAFELSCASSAVEALPHLEHAALDLLVVDHFMPGLPGIELVRRVRAEPRFAELPILMVSVGGKDVKEAALQAGATLYVNKPILLTHLIDTMKGMLLRAEVA